MNVLGIDTSGKPMGVALLSDGRVLGEKFLDAGYRHAERLMPTVEALLAESGLCQADLGGVAVASGPGSFTGLRVGITTARTLAWSLGIPLAGVPTLDALAYNARLHRGLVVAVIDARREAVFSASYRWDRPPDPSEIGRLRTGQIRRVGIRELLEEAAISREPAVFLGDAVPRYPLFSRCPPGTWCGPGPHNFISGTAVALVGQDMIQSGLSSSPLDMSPFYLRSAGVERGHRD